MKVTEILYSKMMRQLRYEVMYEGRIVTSEKHIVNRDENIKIVDC